MISMNKKNYFMTCNKCGFTYEESKLHESHDAPRYLFEDRNIADKFGRRYLCKKCHDKWEAIALGVIMKESTQERRNKVLACSQNMTELIKATSYMIVPTFTIEQKRKIIVEIQEIKEAYFKKEGTADGEPREA